MASSEQLETHMKTAGRTIIDLVQVCRDKDLEIAQLKQENEAFKQASGVDQVTLEKVASTGPKLAAAFTDLLIDFGAADASERERLTQHFEGDPLSIVKAASVVFSKSVPSQEDGEGVPASAYEKPNN